MPDIEKIKKQLKTYGITTDAELDRAFSSNMQKIDIGIMAGKIKLMSAKGA